MYSGMTFLISEQFFVVKANIKIQFTVEGSEESERPGRNVF